ncbi:MAG: putative response regulatory protein [Clostridia bacterium]|jgi:two-component system response regulator YesN|nr:putative response regulatory protein [Clostridia bacterium]
MRIIIAEDEQRSLRGISDLIHSIGEEYTIIAEARDGKKALELIVSLKPDVVFTDIKMPYMDGIELIKAVKKYDIATYFVITSAYGEFEYAKQAISLDVKEYLLKPLTYDEVKQVLCRIDNEMRAIKSPLSIEEGSLVQKYSGVHYLVQRAISMVEVGFSARLSQEEIAESLGMTQEYFSYLFHKETGEKFSDFIRDYRIGRAEELILNSNMKIQDVAYAVGYSDSKYFSKIFKKVTNQTPAEFVKNRKV